MRVGANVLPPNVDNNAGLPLPATQSLPAHTALNLARKAVAWLADPENAKLVNNLSTTAFGACVVWMEASAPNLFRGNSNNLLLIAGVGVFFVGAMNSARNLSHRAHRVLQPTEASTPSLS